MIEEINEETAKRPAIRPMARIPIMPAYCIIYHGAIWSLEESPYTVFYDWIYDQALRLGILPILPKALEMTDRWHVISDLMELATRRSPWASLVSTGIYASKELAEQALLAK